MFKRRKTSILIIPEEGGKTYEFKIPRYVFWLCGIVAVTVVFYLGVGTRAHLSVHRLSQKVSYLEREKFLLAEELKRVEALEQDLRALQHSSSQLRSVLIGPQSTDASDDDGTLPPIPTYEENVPTLERLRWGRVRAVPSLWPVQGAIGRPFESGHPGVFIAAPAYSLVRASAAGQIVAATYDETFGYRVEIDHGKGTRSLYGYNAVLLVSPGQYVQKGQALALSGQSGRTQHPGLYYAVSEGGRFRDPLHFRLWL